MRNIVEDNVEYTDEARLVKRLNEWTANDLIGVAEIASRMSERYGRPITRSNVSTWIDRRETQKNGFPQPVRSLAMGGLYSWVQVIKWRDPIESRPVKPTGKPDAA